MDGVETLHALRALNPAVRIVLSSGYTEQEMAERFTGPGPDGFIQKPYTLDILRDTLRKVLRGGAPSPGDIS
jgi:DNA-binding NarL/FixJ family response regulator